MQSSELAIRDIHLPTALSWWPPAPGWWLIAVLTPLTLLFLLWLYRRLTRKTAIKAANKLLADVMQDPNSDNQEKLCAISVIIRRTAISHYPREQTAGLTGSAWLSFLQQIMPDNRFTEGVGRLLVAAPYQKMASEHIPMDELHTLAEDWLKALSGQKS